MTEDALSSSKLSNAARHFGDRKSRKLDTYDGRLAASRASLNLLLAFPVEDKRRWCFPALPRFARGNDPAGEWVPFKVPTCGPREGGLPTGGCSVAIWVGASLAAAIESESRLDAASDC